MERRQNIRLRAEAGPDRPRRSHRLLDISETGLSLLYDPNEGPWNDGFALGDLFDQDGQWLNELDFRVVSDVPTDPENTSGSRRLSLEFIDRSSEHRERLALLIWSHSQS